MRQTPPQRDSRQEPEKARFRSGERSGSSAAIEQDGGTGDLANRPALVSSMLHALGNGAVQPGGSQWQRAQRQALTAQIGRVQGNRHMQRILMLMSQAAGVSPAHPDGRAGSERQVLPGQASQAALAGWANAGPEIGLVGMARVQRWADPGLVPSWNDTQLRAIQTQLRRLGFYQIRIDGLYGPVTQAGLVEAFGGDQWRTLAPDEIRRRLSLAEQPTGTRGEHRLRYGEMFRDGVMDMTLGIGFDEAGSHRTTIERFREVLSGYGFRDDREAAERIYRQAGRVLGPSAFGSFFVRENALTYTPPAGEPRQVHAVVRLVYSEEGEEGAQAAGALREGMVESDVAYYSGHGRYGSGPDFDRNMSYELLDRDGVVTQRIEDYDVLERVLREEGRAKGRSAWQQFLWRVRHNRINVIGQNAGNVLLNPTNRHAAEFGAKLMYWNLRRTGGAGATPVTGPEGSLGAEALAHPERRYYLWVFDGCRSQDYVKSIRHTPGFGPRSTDILATRRTVQWGDEVATLAAFLESVLHQQSAEQIVRAMDVQQAPERPGVRPGGAYGGYGFEENPVIR